MWRIVFPVIAAHLAVGMGALIGGYRDVDVNSQQVQDVLNYVVVKHNKGTNDVYLRKLAEVERVQTQVVAGIKYAITAKMAKTPCRKDAANEACEIHTDPELAQPYRCKFVVWSRPWINSTIMLEEKC